MSKNLQIQPRGTINLAKRDERFSRIVDNLSYDAELLERDREHVWRERMAMSGIGGPLGPQSVQHA